MSEISKVIESEIADFFAGFGGPGEPDIQSGEAQRLLTERVLSVLALRARAEPVGFVGRNKETGKFASWLYPEAPWLTDDKYEVLSAYITPPAPVVPDDAVVGWVRDEEGDSRDPLFLLGTVRPLSDGKAYNSTYYPVKRAAMLQPVSQPYKLP
ncbi:hypothetical protein SMC38_004056 [Cronobacter sakazakii]|nr:hypothetical protein [Cronobacter sakazakii]